MLTDYLVRGMEDQYWLLWSTLLLSGVGYTLYRLYNSIHSFRSYAEAFKDCPGEKDFHWLYGTMHTFPGPNEKGIQFETENMDKYPRFAVIWSGPLVPVVLVYHPDLVRPILKSSAPKPRGNVIPSAYEMALDWLGEGLLISNGARWARSRRLLTPAFHFDILRPYLAVKNQACDVLLDKLKGFADRQQPFETFEQVSLCLFDILLQCAFNHKSNCQTTGENDRYVQNINELVSLWTFRALRPWLHMPWAFRLSSSGRRWHKACQFVHSVSEDLINRRRTALEESRVQTDGCNEHAETKVEGPDPDRKKPMLSFVDILLTAKDEDGKGMTPLEIRNEADTFLFEGFDTTTSALSWTLYSLARWPQHQTRVQQEVDALLKGRNSDWLLWEDLNSLPYTTACIKEAMRNYATVPNIERQTTEAITLDGHVIPPGTYVDVQIWKLHHNPQVWDRPHDYIPERFLDDSVRDPFQFVPFSAGSRNCIGQNFAMHELKAIVARICHRFTLKVDPNHEVRRSALATFKAENDIKLFVTPR